MAYIGSKPADKALTSADIEDGAIQTVDIADGAVTSVKTTGVTSDMFRNIIINGDMSIAQRGTSASGITGTDATSDRWRFAATTAGTWTISQSTDVPTGQGFATSFKADCTTANASLSAGSILRFTQFIEGQNLQYLKKGTASATSLTMSFWVRSAKTGTYIVNLKDRDNTRDISKSYTIDTADTWEKKTLTFAGDTTGVFDNNNDWSLEVHFYLVAGTTYSSGTLNTSWNSTTSANIAVGQINLADDTANDWYVTGVQLEAGTTASDFEFLPYDVNLRRCLRYYYLHASGAFQHISMGAYYGSGYLVTSIFFPVEMRSVPSFVTTTGGSYYRFYRNNGNDDFDSFDVGLSRATKNSTGLEASQNLSGTIGQAGVTGTTNASSLIAFKSEFF